MYRWVLSCRRRLMMTSTPRRMIAPEDSNDSSTYNSLAQVLICFQLGTAPILLGGQWYRNHYYLAPKRARSKEFYSYISARLGQLAQARDLRVQLDTLEEEVYLLRRKRNALLEAKERYEGQSGSIGRMLTGIWMRIVRSSSKVG